jgi:DNA polymerase-3 subunit alpha
VRDITQNTLEQIEQCRPFDSLADFLSKIKLSERETENLIRIGFFDSIEKSRPKLLWQYRLWGKGRHGGDGDLFGGRVLPPGSERLPQLVEFSSLDIFKAERNILEIPASFNPLLLFDDYKNFDPGRLSGKRHNSSINVSGWLADRKRIKTRDGKFMVFLTFDSLDDTFEVILFPDIYNQYSEIIRRYRYLTIDGRVNLQEGSPAIVAEHISPADTGLKKAKFI